LPASVGAEEDYHMGGGELFADYPGDQLQFRLLMLRQMY